MSTMENDPRLIAERSGLAGVVPSWRRRLASGDLGQLPVVIGLMLIWGIFLFASNGKFFLPINLVNLSLQMAATGTIAVGVVFVLLLGEIDLTVGVLSGLSAAIMAVLNVKMGLPGPVAVISAIGTGMLIGLFHGFWITRFRIPAFVVTLAGQIAWQGTLLFVIGANGTINLRDGFITAFAGTFFKGPSGYALGALLIAYVGLAAWLNLRRRRAAGLHAEAMSVLLLRVAGLAVALAIAITVLNGDRGVPLSFVLLVTIVVVMDYVLRRTRFGRMVMAVGGNSEAARRAGIPVTRVRVVVFMLASMFSAFGGVLAASYLLAVEQGTGTGPELLNAIAAAVIGGTSLFGGRGSAWAALLGILVIQSISNGMDLLSFQPSFKLMVTGAVLLAAVTIDALARSGRKAAR
jgi:D-xylose transport system permease protein